jgi:hypothetical protein
MRQVVGWSKRLFYIVLVCWDEIKGEMILMY